MQRGVSQATIAGQQRRLADVAGEHVRAANGGELRVKRRSHGLLEQALAQADAGLARGDSSDEAGAIGSRTVKQVGKQRDPSLAIRRGRDLREGRCHVLHGQRRIRRRRVGQQLAGRIAEVRVTEVGRADLFVIGAGGARERRTLLDPAHAELRGRVSQRPSAEEGRGGREVIGTKIAEVRGEEIALRVLAARCADGGGRGGQIGERARCIGHGSGV